MTENKRMNIKISALIAASITVLTLAVMASTHLCWGIVPSCSMEPTLMTGSFDIRTRRVDTIKRYDAIGFEPENKKYISKGTNGFGKRIIGLPGELIEVKKDGVYADGKKLDDSYVSEENKKIKLGVGRYYVPEDCYFVLGDNRNNSADSRTNKGFTFVKRDWIDSIYVYNFKLITSLKDLRHPIKAIDFKDVRYKK